MTDKYIFTNPVVKAEVAKLKLSTLLPNYIQTRINRNFLDATVQTLFSEDSSEVVSGYIGEKPNRQFNSTTDFYIEEVSKDREDYQLTPAVVKLDTLGNVEKQVFYSDIVNHLRYQGANIDSHERLFRQEYYSFSPFIDIDKFVNYNQYYWLQKGPKTIDFTLVVENIIYSNFTFVIENHGLVTGQEISISGIIPPEIIQFSPYYVIKVSDNSFKIAETYNDSITNVPFEFSSLSITNATINLKTDFNSIIGKTTANIHNNILKNGMVIRTYNDIDTRFNGLRYIVEGIGESIQLLLLDELLGYDSSPYDTQPYDYDEVSYIPDQSSIDYITIQRGSKDQNTWSMRNRWFHISVLTNQQISSALRATAPIIEFKRDIQLFNFGENGKGKVTVVYDQGNIQSIAGLPSASIDGVNVFEGMTVLVINDIDPQKTDKIYKIFGIDQESISFIEIDTLVSNDTVYVSEGNIYGGKHVYLNGTWNVGQYRNGTTADILFQLYDSEGIELNNSVVYPDSSFNGSKLFGYKEDSSYPFVEALDKYVAKNEFDDYVFINYLDQERYNFIQDYNSYEISGSYYFKVNGEYRNHWHKSDLIINQGIVDEFVIEPTFDDFGIPTYPRLFELSQEPELVGLNDPSTIFVHLNGKLLVKNIDYEIVNKDGDKIIGTDKYINLSETLVNTLSSGSFLRVITYNRKPPIQPIAGFYEVPSLIGLVTNSNNSDIIEFGRNDIFEHFVSVLERQNGFTGDALGINNSTNLIVNYGRGNKIVQNTASVTKVAILNSYEETDIISAIKFVTHEYNRFYLKFDQKIIDLYNGGLNEHTSYEEWITTALSELNIGKTDQFPFYKSSVANREFIPPSPAYLGITSMYIPCIFYDTSLNTPQFMMRKHDGQLVIPECTTPSNTQTLIISNSQTDYVLNESVVFPWEIVVLNGNETLVPGVDYTIYGGNTIRITNFIGNITICFISSIVDKVKLFFENEIYQSSPFKEETYKSEFDFLKLTPGYFRKTDYNVKEFNDIISKFFNTWAYEQGADTVTNDTFDEYNPKTWNYSSAFAPNGQNLSGTWKAIFLYFYDSVRPNTHPWEMFGFREKPTWWVTHYGHAPYTGENTLLWQDVENGYIRDGICKGYYDHLKRPNIMSMIPVDDEGNLRDILDIFPQSIPPIQMLKADWKFGDISPVEFEFIRSSYFSFALMATMYLMKPNEFIDLLWEPETNKRLFEKQFFSQLVSSETLKRIQNKNLNIHNTVGSDGNIIVKYGIQQYIVDYLISQGKTAEFLRDIVNNVSVRLGYRCGGFIDNDTSRFVADSFGLLPKENYNVALYKSASTKEIVYSGIILQKVETGYQVYGYDNVRREFDIAIPLTNSPAISINVGGLSPAIFDWVSNVSYQEGTYVRYDNAIYRCAVSHRSDTTFNSSNWARLASAPLIGGITVKKYSEFNGYKKIPYYTVLKTPQEVFDLLIGYEEYLKDNGISFENDENNNDISSFSELANTILLWINSKPSVGDVRAISPLSQTFKVNYDFGHIESINKQVNGQWSVVSGNGLTLTENELLIDREGDYFVIKVDASFTEESIFAVRLAVKEIEHIVIFDNITNFHDIIFDDTLGIRQTRLKAFIHRSTNWDGKMKAGGFIISDNGISSNFDKSVSDFTKFYDIEDYVFGQNLNAASKKLIGYENRKYFNNLLFDDRDAVQFYIGSLREKGTNQGINKLLRNDYVKNISNIEVNEEWAVRIGDYGALNSYSSIDIELNPEDFKSNPQIIKFLESGEDDVRNSIIEIGPNDERFIFKRPLTNNNTQFETAYVIPKLPYAGYLLLDEAKFKLPSYNTQYFFDTFKNITIENNDRLWIAEIGNGNWSVNRIVKDSIIVDMKIENGVIIAEVGNVNVIIGQTVIIDMPDFKSIFKVTDINGNILTLDSYGDWDVDSPEFEDGYSLYTTETVRFENMSTYTQKDDGLHFVDDYQNGKWAILQNDVVVRNQEKQITFDNTLYSKVYDRKSYKNLSELDFYHPLQNVLPFTIRQNIDYILSSDPAKYNSITSENEVWLKNKVGTIWWDLSSVRYIDYDQSSDLYKTNHWGSIFPGTSIDVYQWVRAPYPPEAWAEYLETEDGSNLYSENTVPYSTTDFVESIEYSTIAGRHLRYFYYWVKGNEYIKSSNDRRKTLSTTDIEDLLLNPSKAGIRWISPINQDAFVISNVSEVLNDDSVLKIIFKNTSITNNIHSEWYLFGEKTEDRNPPNHIFDKAKHSLAGYVKFSDTVQNLYSQGFTQQMIDEYGISENGITTLTLPVPDDKLVSITKFGNYFRPRQSWFQDIDAARIAFVYIVNKLLAEEIWTEKSPNWQDYMYLQDPEPETYDYKVTTLYDRDNLLNNLEFTVGKVVLVESDISNNGKWSLWNYTSEGFILIDSQGFRLSDFWEFADYYANGYDSSTFITKEYTDLISRNLDLENLNVGDIIKVLDDGSGNFILNEVIEGGFKLVAKQNGTFNFDKAICGCPYAADAIDNLFDAFVNSLSTIKSRNVMIIELIKESMRQNRVLDWAFKTSIVDLIGLEEELIQRPVYSSDLTENIYDYFNEMKPYHVKIRSAVDRKTSNDDFINISWEDIKYDEVTILIDKVSCVADFSQEVWTAAERIANTGGNPADVIPGCKFRGTEIDAQYFNFFTNVYDYGYDSIPYDSSILGYDFGKEDIQILYDVVINGKDFTSLPEEISNIIDGGNFYQPLLSNNRPPELINFHMGDTLSMDVYTSPLNIEIMYGYDVQPYDAEVDEFNQSVGYDYSSPNTFSFILRPKMVQDLYMGDNNTTVFGISQRPQSNDSIFVYINDILVDNYIVKWDNFKPYIEFTTAPNDKDSVKILSYSIGGLSNTLFEKYQKDISSNIFETNATIISNNVIFATVNGVEVPTETFASGSTDLSNSQIRIPSANVGDTVYLVVFNGEGFAKVTSQKVVYADEPISSNGNIFSTKIYKDGKLLAPSYIRYYDPVESTNTFTAHEIIREKEFIKVYVDGAEYNSTLYEIINNEIITNNDIVSGSEVIITNDNIADYHFDNDQLFIHTIADATVVLTSIPNNSRININGGICDFEIPMGSTIPVDIEVGYFNLVGANITGTIGSNGQLSINGNTINFVNTDTIITLRDKINTLDSNIKAYIDGDNICLRSHGYSFELTGNWNNLGFVNGSYKTIVKQLQDTYSSDYRFLTLDGYLRIIWRQGKTMTILPNGSYDIPELFGLSQDYSNVGSKIVVNKMDNDDMANIRTEVYEGNVVGEYPVTRNGFSDYSTIVSVIGNDSIKFSDFDFASLDFGYDYYGYDLDTYDYSNNPGILFNMPHNQSDTIVITTYNGNPRDATPSFKMFKNLRNEVSYHHLFDEFKTEITQPVYQDSEEIFVKDISNVGKPSPELNIPAYIWVNGEVIGYFEIDETTSSLKKLIRGAMGSAFGLTTNGEFIEIGTEVFNMSDSKMNIKDTLNYLNM